MDYGKFLVKKYRIFSNLRIYELLILFATINVASLFLMFVETFEFRLINSILLLISLVFAIYYFFAYIISENKLVKRQIYEDELYGLYYDSNQFDHQEADLITEMNSGSRTSKKLSSNVISFFNTYNSESQHAFEEVFGSGSLLYNYSKRARNKLKKKYHISPYEYRNNSNGIHDISYEYFQFFRHSDLQDKWTIEILRIFDGDRIVNQGYEPLRLYNFARVITHLNLFGNCDNIYKYKFLEYLISFYYHAVYIADDVGIEVSDLAKVKEVEAYIFKQLMKFMLHNENKQRDSTFNHKAQNIMEDIILKGKYNGSLQTDEMIMLFLEKTLEVDSELIKNLFTDILDKYYQAKGSNIPESVTLEKIRNRISVYQIKNEQQSRICPEELFGAKVLVR